ncbi:sel1 repeat family protein [Burkholderiales bacterium]|nr:sel1 repeat family protein [Burkholderiales bacterium]
MNSNYFVVSALLLALTFSSGLKAEEEPEARPDTFTDTEANKDMLDPYNLGLLVERGDVKAINNVGLLWATGHDGKQSFVEAVKWWTEAANRGYPLAMNNLGLAYANGQGVEKDIKQAFNWWLKAAIGGNAWAMNSVGDSYETGEGVSRDFVLAMTWYKTAADAGDPLAHYNVGALYQTGRGVERNFSSAHDWFFSGAELGDPYSMLSLGDIYRDGVLGAVDLVEAIAWYQVATLRLDPQDVGGRQFSEQEAASIEARLSDQQKQNAQTRFEFLKKFTAPQAAPEKLDDDESSI